MEIQASARKIEIWASTREGSRRVPKKGPGECRKGGNLGEYQRKVESGRVPEKGPGEYRERWDPSEYQKNRNLGEYQRRARVITGRRIREGVESGRVPEIRGTTKLKRDRGCQN